MQHRADATQSRTRIDISHATLYRLINAGRHDARKIDNKTVITHESICRYIEALPKAGEGA